DHYQAIAIPVKGDAEIRLHFGHLGNQVPQVVCHRWIGGMVGKVAVNVTVQGGDLASQFFEQAGRKFASDAVARIHHHGEFASNDQAGKDALHVLGADIHEIYPPAALVALLNKVSLQDSATQSLYFRVLQRVALDHDLEAVIRGRVLAGGDHHNAAAFFQFVT